MHYQKRKCLESNYIISFIIIGRNEGWKLTKCFKSIFGTISYNNLKDYEVIYVDSNSTDDSVKRAKKFCQIKIFKLTKDYNAAIARNVGAEVSKGEVLFFIDGDMEIRSEFYKLVYGKNSGFLYDFVSGNFENHYYDSNGHLLGKEKYFKFNKSVKQKTTGGLFLIKRHIWQENDGMRPVFKRSQDIDFALRLAKKKIFLIRLPKIAAVHHTINYNSTKRKWQSLWKGDYLFGHSLLLRQNLFNKYCWERFIRNDYTSVLFLFSVIISVLTSESIFFLLYFLGIFFRSAVKNKKNIIKIIEELPYFFIRDILILFGTLFFWPKNNFKIEKIIIQ